MAVSLLCATMVTCQFLEVVILFSRLQYSLFIIQLQLYLSDVFHASGVVKCCLVKGLPVSVQWKSENRRLTV